MNAETSRNVLGIAIVGGGKMAQHHAGAIQKLGDRALVKAVVDPVGDARARMLELCPRAEGYSSIEQALARGGVDVVHVCTPPSTHAAVAEAALRAGCSVYVEKPFAATRAEAEQLAQLAADMGLKLCAGHQLLFEGPALAARELTPSLGKIVHIESYFSFRPVRRSRDGGAPMRAEDQLLDILPHPVYLLLAFMRLAEPAGETRVRSVRVGRAGTVHALIGRGELDAALVVTLAGRPVESYLRVVGDNGLVVADFVRGTTQRLIGPGSSGIDKLLNPFRLAAQLFTQTTRSLVGRFVGRRRSYPGLVEIFSAFYESILSGGPPPMASAEIVETVSICEEIARALPDGDTGPHESRIHGQGPAEAVVAVTGGTGFLGRSVVKSLSDAGVAVRALARRVPPSWDRLSAVEYEGVDLGSEVDPKALGRAHTVIHCAAETAGGWDDHQRNSLDATENLIRAAVAAGVERLIHVSSLAVVTSRREPVSEATPLLDASRSRGPYVWGKLESERIAVALGRELGLKVKIVRPGALVDYDRFDPPGRLGRRIGNVFVAVGSRRDTLGITSLRYCSDALVWISQHFDRAPSMINLIEPDSPTKRELVQRLKARNPGILVVWLPRVLLHPLSWTAMVLQKVLRPGVPAINVARVFAREKYDTDASAELARQIGSSIEVSQPNLGSVTDSADGFRSAHMLELEGVDTKR